MMLITVIISSCGASTENSPGIEGAYIAFSNNEFSITKDTISISVLNKKGGTYFIQHRAGYQRIRKGRLQEKESKETNLIGHWQEGPRQLKTEKLGRVYSFSEDGRLLLMGTVPYTKIKTKE